MGETLPANESATASYERVRRGEVLVVTSWYATPKEPHATPFIKDHVAAWIENLFEPDGTQLAVVHPIEALSVLAGLKHRQATVNRDVDEGSWRVVQVQQWRLARRWSESDVARETRSVVDAIQRFPQFRERPPRLIVAQTLSAARLALQARRALAWRAPVVLVEHSAPLTLQFQVEKAVPLQKQALEDADEIIVVSERLAESVAEYAHGRTAHVISNPVDPATFTAPLPEAHESGPLRLVNVGFATEQKAQEILIRAVAILARRGIEIEADIVGGGPALERLRRESRDLGVEHIVRLHGSLPRGGVVDALAAAHMFVFPSRWENCPVALQEAQAVGLPVVVARNGASEKILVHEDSRVCDLDDADALAASILELAGSPPRHTARERRELARAAFAPERFAARCASVFQTAIRRVEGDAPAVSDS